MNINELTFPADEILSGDIPISQSLLYCIESCDWAGLFQLNRWEKPGSEENFFYGACCHELMDIIYSNHHMPPEKEEIIEYLEEYLDSRDDLQWLKKQKRELYITTISVVMYNYFQYYEEDFDMIFHEVEDNFKVKFYGLTLTGKKDGVIEVNNEKLLFEHKTKSIISENNIMLMLEFDFQVFFYTLAHYLKTKEYLDGVLYNIIRRPKSNPGKDETLKQYGERLNQIIQKDYEHFFKRYQSSYTLQQHKNFKKELIEKLKQFKLLLKNKRKKTRCNSSCLNGFACDYLKACSTGSLNGYKQREHLSPELI